MDSTHIRATVSSSTLFRVQALIGREWEIAIADATPDMVLRDHLDSLEVIELVAMVEVEFGVEILLQDEARFRTVGDVAVHVDQLLRARSA